VNASGYFNYDSGTVFTPRCSITTGTTIDFTHLIIAEMNSNTNEFDAWGATRVFTVPSPGTRTYRLVCDTFAGTGTVADTSLNGIYVPTRY
jgi:hypothetical protein